MSLIVKDIYVYLIIKNMFIGEKLNTSRKKIYLDNNNKFKQINKKKFDFQLEISANSNDYS